MSCKCVCKPWRNLLETREFVKSHLSNSVPGLVVYLKGKKQYRIVEFVDEHRLNIVFCFDLPFISSNIIMHSSVNGLLFVCNPSRYESRDLFICNPITRKYIKLSSPLEPSSGLTIYDIDNIYGFGVSKMSGQYKVVRINCNGVNDCQVYTVGTGSWRRIECDDRIRYKRDKVGAFLNGNLHWLTSSGRISCLDLETERFSTFSPPPYDGLNYRIFTVLGDDLCVCHTYVQSCHTYVQSWGAVTRIDIWLMKEYGDEKSWTKEFVIDTCYMDQVPSPIKVFKDGDILMQWGSYGLLYYSGKLQTIREVDLFKDDRSCTIIYTPSIFPLETFAMENVTSF